MTQAEVLHALDTLDRLDRQHGHKLSHGASYLPPSSSSSMTSTATQTSFPENRLSPSPCNNYNTSPPLPMTVPAPVAMGAVAQNGLVAVTNGKLSPPQFPVGMVSGSVAAPGYGFETSEEDMDVDDKVEELMR